MHAMIRAFQQDEDGSMAVELVMVVPIMVWALLSTFVYFDAYRVESNAHRAALTIADMYSRETTEVSPAYLEATHALLKSLTFEEANPDYRITSYYYDEPAGRYRVVWSRHRGYGQIYNDTRFKALQDANRLPILANQDRSLLLETRVQYDPPFSIGLGPFTVTDMQDITFETFTVIRARDGRVCWDQRPNNPNNAILC